MADPKSPLNPTAPTFVMSNNNNNNDQTPSSSSTTAPAADTINGQPSSTTTTTTKGHSKSSSTSKRPEPRPSTTLEDIAEAGAGVKLTPAQLKKQKAAEKAARRAGKLAERGAQAQAENEGPLQPGQQQPGPVQARETQDRQRRMSTANREGSGGGGATSGGGGAEGGQQHRRTTSTTVRLPVRGGSAQQQQQQAGSSQQQQQSQQQSSAGDRTAVPPKEKTLDRRVPMLSHLYSSSSTSGRRASLATADRQIHPAVLTLGLQLRDYVICGSNARTVATLLVFKKVIRSYDTPSGVALSRDLTRHLSHQINFLSQARQLSIAQGNSIRWIKKLISALDPDLADTEAKTFLCGAIDTFIRERVTLADEVIASQAVARLDDQGEVILTYGKSSVVEKTLVSAWEAGKRFKVIVADSRPLFEGKNLCRSLIRAGLDDVQYCLLSGLADAVERGGVTKCLLGASAMLGNGNLRSRAGSAMVAMMAKESAFQVPVIVLCESVKFTAKAALDSVAMNEVADPDVLVERDDPDTLVQDQPTKDSSQQQQRKKGTNNDDNNNNNTEKENPSGLNGWKSHPNLYLVQLMYDVTPAAYLDLVISELGSLPPGAVPVVGGGGDGDE